MRRRTIISTETSPIPLRKRVTHAIRQFNQRNLSRFGKKATRFVNTQFAFIVIAFFVFSLNAVSAPLSAEDSLTNPLTQYNPDSLTAASSDINPYVPILSGLNQNEVNDQLLSAVVGQETTYIPKPMLVETVDHDTASRIRRGLRKETVTHAVAQGESLSKIASVYGINVATLLKDNDIKDVNSLKPGMKLTIAPETTTHSVEWLDKLHEEERKAREQREKERRTQLAKANAGRGISKARAANIKLEGTGKFRKPIGSGCYNGYHWYAIDCPASPGAAIFAAAAGRVVEADAAGYNGGYGKTIVIDHGNGWETRYAHMSSIKVSSGELVSAGEVVGGVGDTGRSTGSHLHFEIIKNGQRFNPVSYVGT